MSEPRGLIASFTQHKVASNLLMLLMVMLGFLGLNRLNTQLFPNFDFDYITVTIPWRGASPEDVQRSITIPVEQAIKLVASGGSIMTPEQADNIHALVGGADKEAPGLPDRKDGPL